MLLTVEQILNSYPEGLTLHCGSSNSPIKDVTPPEKTHEQALVFASTPALLTDILNKSFGAVCIPNKLVGQIPAGFNKPVLIYKDLSSTFAAVFPLFVKPVQNTSITNYPNFVDPTATIGKQVVIEPFAVIGRNVTIGDGCRIGSHTVIEEDSFIGQGTILNAHVVVGPRTEIGRNCIIHSNATIGADGFGFSRLKNSELKKIPQLGRVVIEHDVEIGANSTVDRATMDETRICYGTKLDDHCHIAHNCTIGPNNVLAAGFWIAGSSTTGANLTAGGCVDITDHVNVTDNVVLGGRSGVTNDITEPGVYSGYPLQPFKQAIKNLAIQGKLTEMRKQINTIMKKLGIEGEE